MENTDFTEAFINDKLYESEKQEFIDIYRKRYFLPNKFFQLAFFFAGFYCFGGAITALMDHEISIAVTACIFGILIALGIHKFRTKIILGPIVAIENGNYVVFRERVTDKYSSTRSTHHSRGGTSTHTTYYLSTANHQDAEAVSCENWKNTTIGDEICIIDVRRVKYAMKF